VPVADWDPSAAARRLWARFETIHDVVYFSPEAVAVTRRLGCRGWTGYFGVRTAPLGAPPAAVVASVLHHYYAPFVARWMPDTWRVARPPDYLRVRLAAVDTAMRGIVGDHTLAQPWLAEAAELALAAARLAPVGGCPLGAANAGLPVPRQPHLALWHATTVLRECRGGVHACVLTAAGLDPGEGLVLFGSDPSNGIRLENLLTARRWPRAAWTPALARLVDRGLVDEHGVITTAGRLLRRGIERRTDAIAALPWAGIGQLSTERLARLLTPLAARLLASTDALDPGNPIGLDAATALAA
jgi:hypothetical protein